MHAPGHNLVKSGLATALCRSHKPEFEQHAAHFTGLCVSCSKADACISNMYVCSTEATKGRKKDSETVTWQIV